MNKIFIDTSAFIAFFDKSDNNHLEATLLMNKIKKNRLRLLTSDYIFDETITMALSRGGHELAVKVGEYLLSSKVIELIWLDESHIKKSWKFFRKQFDKNYSFTDCTSFVLMKGKGVIPYFAFDEHFKQAGFLNIKKTS
ncbi:MAG: type II toxin-antitoxin system VapC family toxin [Desulfobacterales bacterium]|nr:type II toxin-antitoxin system VapC family toxin [Desulfobacterales bacterium]